MNNIESDLGLNVPFSKGQSIRIRNCWHFTTDGNAVDAMFYDKQDFRDGVNRILAVKAGHNITILAFVLMDTHFHFVLHGNFDECNRFVHEYVRRTSMAIAYRHRKLRKLDGVPINHQVVDDDRYLKSVICYTVKNPVAAGMPYTPWDYPWSSGPLYFRTSDSWTSPERPTPHVWTSGLQQRNQLRSHSSVGTYELVRDEMVFPGCFVDTLTVERIFRSHKSYFYFLSATKDIEVDERGGKISHLSLPIQEMRQIKWERCKQLFGTGSTKSLNTSQRIILAKKLRAEYNSSVKQIARLCGLVYDEVKDMI